MKAAASGVFDAKVRELIAIAVAVTGECDGCVTTHVKTAIEHGVTRDEIAAALAVAVEVNAGATQAYSARALDVYDARMQTIRHDQAEVDLAGKDSFPASDPPPWAPPGRSTA